MGPLIKPFIEWLREKSYTYMVGPWANFTDTQKQATTLIIEIDTPEQVAMLHKSVYQFNQKVSADKRIKIRSAAGWHDRNQRQANEDRSSSCFKFFGSLWRPHTQVGPWPEIDKEAHNESYSLAPIVAGKDEANPPIILRFSEKFQKHYALDSNNVVSVPAGMQLGATLDFLATKGRTLDAAYIPTYVSMVGAAATGTYGTGLNSSSIAGLVEELTYVDALGNMITLNAKEILCRHTSDTGTLEIGSSATTKYKDKPAQHYFEALRVHLGLLGTVVNVKLKTIEDHGVEQTFTTYKNIPEMFNDIRAIDLLDTSKVNGLVIMGMATKADMPMWSLTQWKNIPMSEVPHPNRAPNYDPSNPNSFLQHVETVAGAKFLNLLLEAHASEKLCKLFTRVAARFTMGKEAIHKDHAKVTKGSARAIEHAQVGYPKNAPLHELSLILPIDNNKLSLLLPEVLTIIDRKTREYWDKGLTPVMLAYCVRLSAGMQNGLSATACGPNQSTLTIEMATHAKAPGLEQFLAELIPELEKAIAHKLQYHPAKIAPSHIHSFADYMPAENLQAFKSALELMPEITTGAKQSYNPFMIDHLDNMMNPKPAPMQLVRDESNIVEEKMGHAEVLGHLQKLQANWLEHQLLDEHDQLELNSVIEQQQILVNSLKPKQAAYK